MPTSSPIAARRSALRHRALPAALAALFGGIVHAAAASSPGLWQQLALDPRARHADTLDFDERLALARDYGLERLVPHAQGATIAVANCNDAGAGSLRAAVAAASNGDTIDASHLGCSKITLSTGSIAIAVDDLTIRGPGPDQLLVTNGAKYGRVFNHAGNGSLTLMGMHVHHGVVSPGATESGTNGGCIHSNGAVNLGNPFAPANRAQGVIVSGCTAMAIHADERANGGGVFAETGLSLSSSVISGCSAAASDDATRAYGGGARLAAGDAPFAAKYSEIRGNSASGATSMSGGVHANFVSSVLVQNTTIAGNSAGSRAGGAYLGTSSGNDVDIENSTISGNTSAHGEAGLVVNTMSSSPNGDIRLRSSTITDNSSGDSAFAGALLGGPVELQGTIISGNLADGVPSDLRINGAASGADNLVGTTTAQDAPASGRIASDEPGLAPLANHGGLARTHALLPTSPAIDAGNNAPNADHDQRGEGHPRVLGARADIGAFERDADVIFDSGFE